MNQVKKSYLLPPFSVLIDTWWNVNARIFMRACKTHFVLIDTWWNVNTDQRIIFKGLDHVLIDTWWNVNMKWAIELDDSMLF